jgi:hypothetical protein
VLLRVACCPSGDATSGQRRQTLADSTASGDRLPAGQPTGRQVGREVTRTRLGDGLTASRQAVGPRSSVLRPPSSLLQIQRQGGAALLAAADAELVADIQPETLVIAVALAQALDAALVQAELHPHGAQDVRGVEGDLQLLVQEGLVQPGVELAEGLQFVELLLAAPDHEPAEGEARAGGDGQAVEGEEPPAPPGEGQGLPLVEALVLVEVELPAGHEEISPARG